MSAAQTTRDLVVGLGATGLSIARYLHRSDIDAAFFDTRAEPPGLDEVRELYPDADLMLGDLRMPSGIGRVIASPGIPDTHPLLAGARKTRMEIISDIELFAREANAPYIAVTGSNGKSTVTTLLYHFCRAAGLDVRAGGNLGQPALDLLEGDPPDIYVLELSSFQLHRTQRLPADVSVLLNVSPDHLDWHASENEYRETKYRIYREAKSAVVNRADPTAAERTGHLETLVTFGFDEPEDGHYGLRVDDGQTYLSRGETLLISTDELALIGRHNQANALAAMAAGELAGIEVNSMLEVLCEFPGLEHRMQFVARIGSVDYVNDSKATNVGAAVASIDSIEGSLVLVAGGDGKGGDFTELGAALENKLRAAVLVGKDAQAIAGALDTVMPVYFATDMDDAVQQASRYAEAGDTVLLAPACASLDQYRNYEERGDAFAQAVGGLKR